MQSTPLRSFGRRHGRKLKASHADLVDKLLPQLMIPVSESPLEAASLFANPAHPLRMEIGFGGGEHLVGQAVTLPEVNFIGCEPYMNGMAKLLAVIDRENLNNIRLYDDDARVLLARFPDASFARLDVLFPDPWPKARHHKRRIISQDTLELFHNKLLPGGILRLATDHAEYGAWMLEQLMRFGKLRWTAEREADWTNPPSDWIPTRYQRKAEEEGRPAMFLEWIKFES